MKMKGDHCCSESMTCILETSNTKMNKTSDNVAADMLVDGLRLYGYENCMRRSVSQALLTDPRESSMPTT